MDKSKLITWDFKEVILNKNLLGPAIGLLVAFSSFFYSQRGAQVGLTQGGDPLKKQEILGILSSGNKIPVFKFTALLEELGRRSDNLFTERVNQLMKGTGNIESIKVTGYLDSKAVFELTGTREEVYLNTIDGDLESIGNGQPYSYLVEINSTTGQGCQANRTFAFSSQRANPQVDTYIVDYNHGDIVANFTDSFATPSFFFSDNGSYQIGAAAMTNFQETESYCTNEG